MGISDKACLNANFVEDKKIYKDGNIRIMINPLQFLPRGFLSV